MVAIKKAINRDAAVLRKKIVFAMKRTNEAMISQIRISITESILFYSKYTL